MEHKCKTNYRNENKPVCEACEHEFKMGRMTDNLAIAVALAGLISFMVLVGLAQ